MELEITDAARVLLDKRGGTMTIDFIRPTGWGKVAEVSVDTNTKNKNLAPYSRIRHPEYRILVTPVLSGMASRMRITTRGTFVKNLVVELSDERHRPVYVDGDDCWIRVCGRRGRQNGRVGTRNLVWLGLIVVAFVVGWVASGWLVGVIAGVVVLVISEVVERTRRRRAATAAGTEVPSVRRAVTSQRKRR